MNIQWNGRSILGLALVILAVVSLLVDIAGVIQLWSMRGQVTQDASNTLELLDSTLDTTAEGLGIAKSSLKSVTGTIGALETTVNSAAATIENASASVNSVSDVVGSNLSNTVNSALGTLDVVESTTQKIDEVLSGLANLPLINLPYDPEQSLSSSVSELTEQLRQVPISLAQMETSLATSGSSLEKVSGDARNLATSLSSVQEEMSELVGVIERYETQVKAFQGTVRGLRENVGTVVWGIVLFVTFVLFWLGVTMVQTLWKGLEWMGIAPKWFENPAPKVAP
jgi:methyl-accepting chemotaxis protein